MASIPRIPIERYEEEQTPLDAPTPISKLTAEVKLLREQTARVADYAMQAVKEIPELKRQIHLLQAWHMWLPTGALVAVAVRLWLQ